MESITDRRQALEKDARDWLDEKAGEFHGDPRHSPNGLPIPEDLSHWIKTEGGGEYQASSVHAEGVYLRVSGADVVNGETGPIFYEWSELIEYQIFAVVEMVESIFTQLMTRKNA